MTEDDKSAPPMYNLHRKVFPVLLRLACDVDQVLIYVPFKYDEQNKNLF